MSEKSYKIIDLFAGIGGIRLGFEHAGAEKGIKINCVFSSDNDKYACKTYEKNYLNDDHDPYNDITKHDANKIPEFDILLAGFPCQAFSIAGRRGGFEDTRGTLFFDVARILKQHMPRAFLLENVKGFVNHRRGRTLDTVLNVLQEDLGYISTQYKIFNAKYFGVPQNRERIYIVGFKDCGGGFKFPTEKSVTKKLSDIIEEKPVSVKYYLSDVYVASMRKHRARHEAKGNGFGYEIRDYNDVANAIVVGGMGKERNLLVDKRLTDFTPVTNIKGKVNREGIRRMTPLEWERLQGFPDNWTEGVADVQRYKQLGNSVAVPVIKALADNIIKELTNPTPFVDQTTRQYLLELESEEA
jgi:DNA (cytosine-5)-methyltransferase 1